VEKPEGKRQAGKAGSGRKDNTEMSIKRDRIGSCGLM
jgi:hypothetical protein